MKRQTKGRGRPEGFSPVAAVHHMWSLAPSPLDTPPSCRGDDCTTGHCPLCLGVLERPLELGCGKVVCASCCCRWVQINNNLSCPCCDTHFLDREGVKPPSEGFLQLLGQISHHPSFPASPSHTSARAILQRPADAPPLAVEKRLTEHLVRKMLAQDPSKSVINVPTQGHVSY